jgi:hypothetical protein
MLTAEFSYVLVFPTVNRLTPTKGQQDDRTQTGQRDHARLGNEINVKAGPTRRGVGIKDRPAWGDAAKRTRIDQWGLPTIQRVLIPKGTSTIVPDPVCQVVGFPARTPGTFSVAVVTLPAVPAVFPNWSVPIKLRELASAVIPVVEA